MTSDVFMNIKETLKHDILGVCNAFGCIVAVYEVQAKTCECVAEDLTGQADVDVHYRAKLCNPAKDSTVICEIVKFSKTLIVAKNGPIMVLITNNRINIKFFEIADSGDIVYKATKKPLENGDKIRITADKVKFNAGDRSILVVAFLEDMATGTERESYLNEINNKDEDFIDPTRVNEDVMDRGSMQDLPGPTLEYNARNTAEDGSSSEKTRK
jgi:DNA-directed RNA polymerase subunit E'/Rpb7